MIKSRRKRVSVGDATDPRPEPPNVPKTIAFAVPRKDP